MEKEYLDHAIIELTSNCNLKCEHCYNWWKQEGKVLEGFDSYRRAFALLDYLIRTTTVKRVVFTGGEPTISERFVELVLHARMNGLKVTVLTNGNGPLEVYNRLVALRVDMIEFSVHAFRPEVHDRITGVSGSWERMMAALEFAVEEGRNVVPMVVVSKHNYPYVKECLESLHRMGLHRFVVNRYNIGGQGLNYGGGLSAGRDELRQTFREVDDLASALELDIASVVCTPHCLLDPREYPHIRFGNCSLDPYNRLLTFDIVGNVRLCNHSPVIAGNIYNESLAEILYSDYASAWGKVKVRACEDCRKWDVCRGGCRAAAEQIGGSLVDVDPVVSELMLEPFLI